MQPHQQRVVDEKAELSDKLDKLETFNGGFIEFPAGWTKTELFSRFEFRIVEYVAKESQ